MTDESSAAAPDETAVGPEASDQENDKVQPKSQDDGKTEGPAKPESSGAIEGDGTPQDEAGQAAERPKIQVGSRRAADAPKTSRPKVSGTDRPPNIPGAKPPVLEAPKKPEPVPTPSRRDPLSAEMEAELNSAMANVSIDALIGSEATAAGAQEIELEAKRQASVERIHGDNVFFSLGGRNEGVVSVRVFKEPPTVGQSMEVVVKKYQADEGLYELSIPGASVDVADWSDLNDGSVVDARVSGANTGGLEAMVNNIRGFIPASQIALFRVEDFAEYIGQKLTCVVTEVNPKRKNLVLSHRAFLERERQEAREKLLAELQPGAILEGTVRNIRDFGAFVDLGGVDGMIHISQLSWDRVNHPSEVVQEGQKVSVRIEKINQETGKISLSYRELQEHPWKKAGEEFEVGSVVTGKVTRVAKFGAFVKLAVGIEGLIHISELAHQRIRQVGDVVSEGQEVEVKVLSIDTDAQRIGLSLKANIEPPEKAAAPEEEDVSGRTAALAAQRKGPLKGGVDRPSGGGNFGLKW